MKTIIVALCTVGLCLWVITFMAKSEIVQAYSNAVMELNTCQTQNTVFREALGIDDEN